MIQLISELFLSAHYWFWKLVTGIRGGVIGRGVRIYERVKIFSTKNSPVFIGEKSVLQTGVILASSGEGKISLGRRTYLGAYTMLSSKCGITIGDNTIIAAQCFVCDFDHKFDDPDVLSYDAGFNFGKVNIGEDVWIGAGCRILRGVNIGDKCVIGAGSVVTRDIPSYSVAVGSPARVIKQRRKS